MNITQYYIISMRKLYASMLIIAAAFAYTTAAAQEYLGYTDGTRGAGYKFGSQREQGMAMYVSAEKASKLVGRKVLGIRTVFRSLQNRGVSVFLSKDLEQDPVCTKVVEDASNEWTDYMFDEPYTIDGSAFYAGLFFKIASSRSTPLGFDSSGDFNDGLFWVVQDDEWCDASGAGLGAANIQLVLDSRPATTDLVNKRLALNGVYKKGKAYTFQGKVFNMGTEPIKSIDVSVRLGDSEEKTVTRGNLNILPGEVYTYTTASYTLEADGQQTLSIRVTPTGLEDADMSDNTSNYVIGVLAGSIKRKVLVEGYTTQGCGNCPAGHSALHKVLDKSPEDFVVVNHHSAFGTDRFTTLEDYQWQWFFGQNNGTYAPAVMFNRTVIGEEEVPVFSMADYDFCMYAANQMLALDAPLKIDLENAFDEATGQGSLTVTIETFATPSNGKHMLNVFITQDSVKGIQMDYDNGNQRNYVHNNIFRQTLTSYWGEEIELVPGQVLKKTYPYVLTEKTTSTYGSETYGSRDVPTDFKNMHLVAFVADHDEDDCTKCPVYNAEEICVLTQGTGIISTERTTEAPVFYDLQGRRIDKPSSAHGIVITSGKKQIR